MYLVLAYVLTRAPAYAPALCVLQAQGLKSIYGEGLKEVILQHGVVLAAHGPYTAEGVREVSIFLF